MLNIKTDDIIYYPQVFLEEFIYTPMYNRGLIINNPDL